MSLQGSLSIERMCQLVAVSRRSFYRSLKGWRPAEEEMEVRSAIQQIALEHRRRYGYRRITAELHRRGMRSEEHTSELQSLAYLVCRLLLEKKKKHTQNIARHRPHTSHDAAHHS